MLFKQFFAPPSKHQRRSGARQSSGRRLRYESLENRRLLAVGLNPVKNGSVLTISIDGNTKPAFVSQLLNPGDIRVAEDALGAGNTDFTGITRIEINDVNSINDAQSVTFLNEISLPDGLEIAPRIEKTNINGVIKGVAQGSSVLIQSGEINLQSNIETEGGEVHFSNLGNVVLKVSSNATIRTGANGVSFAGDVSLDKVVGPGGLTIDATADGDVVFDNIGVGVPLAHLNVTTTGELTWLGRRIRTNGDVILSASNFSVQRPFLSIDSQSMANTQGGDVKLNFTNVDRSLQTLQVSTLGNSAPDGTAVLPHGFDRKESVGTLEVFEEPTTNGRIILNTSAVTPTTILNRDFTNGDVTKIQPLSGTNWNISGNRYHLAPAAPTGDAVALIGPLTLPANFAFSATVNMSGAGKWSNGLLIFDYVSPSDYKYAGVADGVNEYIIGEVSSGVANKLKTVSGTIASNTNINLRIEIRGTKVDLIVGGNTLTETFGAFNGGQIGFGTMQSNTSFDDLLVRTLT